MSIINMSIINIESIDRLVHCCKELTTDQSLTYQEACSLSVRIYAETLLNTLKSNTNVHSKYDLTIINEINHYAYKEPIHYEILNLYRNRV